MHARAHKKVKTIGPVSQIRVKKACVTSQRKIKVSIVPMLCAE